MSGRTPTGAGRRGTAADLLIAALVIASPLAAGTVHLATWSVAFVLATAAWALSTVGEPTVRRTPALVEALLFLYGAVLLVQLIPLPAGLVSVLSPETARLRAGAGDPAWYPLHLAPGTGAFRVLRWATLFGLTEAVFARGGTRVGRRRLESLPLLAFSLAILAAGVHTLLGARAVFGVYTPRWDPRTVVLAPLISENHWGAYLGLAAPLGLGAALRPGGKPLRALVGALLAAAAVAGIFVGTSRGAAIGLCVAIGALVALEAFGARRRDDERSAFTGRKAARLGAGALVAVLIGVAAIVQIRRETRVIRAPDTGEVLPDAVLVGKLAWFPDGFRMATEFPWTGIGAGATLDVFTGYRNWARRELSAYMEDLPLQLWVDHGFLVGTALFVGLAALVGIALRRAVKRPHTRAPAAALLGLFVHEFFDFSVETGAICFMTVVIGAAALGSRRDAARGAKRTVPLILVPTAVLLVSPLLPEWRLERSWARAREAATVDGATDWEAVGRRMDRLRPASYVANQDLALVHARAGNWDDALQRLSRAQRLAPRHSDPHLYAARVLRRVGAESQALLEYRLALQLNWRYQGQEIVDEVRRRFDGTEAMLRLIPPDDPQMAPRIAFELDRAADPRAAALAEEAARRAPTAPLSIFVQGRARLRARDHEGAHRAFTQVLEDESATPWVRSRAALSIWHAGGREEAIRTVERLLAGPLADDAPLWLVLGRWYRELGRDQEARRALRRARSTGKRKVASDALIEEAHMEAEAGRGMAAIFLLERAFLLADDSAEAHELAARLLLEQGRDERAERHSRRAAALRTGTEGPRGSTE